MTPAFKELAGSPLENYGPEGLEAVRTFLCAWNDREGVVEQLLGDGYQYGGQSRAQYPGKPDIVAMRVRCEPFADDVTPQTLSELTEGLNQYDSFAKITVNYELLLTADRTDLPSIEKGTFLTYRQGRNTETIELPVDGLSWVDQPAVTVGSESAPTIHVPTTEHHLTWHRVLGPPWDTIRTCTGALNDGQFLDAARGTVLFAGARIEREFIKIDSFAEAELGWRIDYSFREKAVRAMGGGGVGWNCSYRPLPANDPGWDQLTDANGARLYPYADFDELFRFRA